MDLDTNPTKLTKCVRLIENSDLPRVDCIYNYIINTIYCYNEDFSLICTGTEVEIASPVIFYEETMYSCYCENVCLFRSLEFSECFFYVSSCYFIFNLNVPTGVSTIFNFIFYYYFKKEIKKVEILLN